MNTQIFQVLLTGISDTVKYLRGQDEKKTVSYTHLTLPTSDLV